MVCNYHHHPSPQLFPSRKTETLSPLNTNSCSPSPGPHPPTVCLYDSDDSRNLV